MPELLKLRTSLTDPIRVDWLPIAGAPGRIGMTFSPGKRFDDVPRAVSWQRDLVADLLRLKEHWRIDTLVCLLEQHELVLYDIERLPDECQSLDIELIDFPIPDRAAPSDMESVATLVERMIRRAVSGDRIAICCAAGVGRTGTIAGCVLANFEKEANEVLRILRETRQSNRCPETQIQKDYIRAYIRRASMGSNSQSLIRQLPA